MGFKSYKVMFETNYPQHEQGTDSKRKQKWKYFDLFCVIEADKHISLDFAAIIYHDQSTSRKIWKLCVSLHYMH